MGQLEFEIEGEFAMSDDALWGVVKDFGEVSWLDDDCTCELEGEGVGMLRRISLRGGEPACERLDALREDERAIDYSILSGNPMPIDDYRASMRVESLPDGRGKLVWRSTFEAREGVPEDKALRSVRRLYESVLATMQAKLDARV